MLRPTRGLRLEAMEAAITAIIDVCIFYSNLEIQTPCIPYFSLCHLRLRLARWIVVLAGSF